MLQQNTADISELLEHYLQHFADKFQQKMPTLSTDAYQALINYSYPGNVRELANLCEALVGLCENNRITLADLPARITADTNVSSSDLSTQTKQSEKEIIRQTLKECDGNKTRCAKVLKIQRSTLYNKIRKYGL
ncbi:helix-turn-helix domain-containing protein [Ligilactobacillus pabuli]|uniref:helix-turn-helix domain-containing protein n=1 Tax=Ligilactobacillus pabuli TaxID=2886039 RepID=UPI00403A46B7